MNVKPATSFDWISEELKEFAGQNLYRNFRVFDPIDSVRSKIDGKEVILFSGNDYLGLSRHPRIISAAKQAMDQYGVGARSARLITGTTSLHAALEERIARFEKKERALVFSTGYQANLGALTSLAGPEDEIILDKLNHASLIDAARASGAVVRVYPHKNTEYLKKLLQKSKARRTWIVTDSIFSMDGDLAPLREIVELKNHYGAYLVIDEAHGTGVFGDHGRGVAEFLGVSNDIDVHIGTLSKAVGALGGFVAGKRELIEYLVNCARTFIFSTALPPATCAAATEAFNVIESEPALRKKLWESVRLLIQGLKNMGAPTLDSESPIIPCILGDEGKAVEASRRLFECGFFSPAVRYPTVPKGKARLRITVSAAHETSHITSFLSALKNLF